MACAVNSWFTIVGNRCMIICLFLADFYVLSSVLNGKYWHLFGHPPLGILPDVEHRSLCLLHICDILCWCLIDMLIFVFSCMVCCFSKNAVDLFCIHL